MSSELVFICRCRQRTNQGRKQWLVRDKTQEDTRHTCFRFADHITKTKSAYHLLEGTRWDHCRGWNNWVRPRVYACVAFDMSPFTPHPLHPSLPSTCLPRPFDVCYTGLNEPEFVVSTSAIIFLSSRWVFACPSFSIIRLSSIMSEMKRKQITRGMWKRVGWSGVLCNSNIFFSFCITHRERL